MLCLFLILSPSILCWPLLEVMGCQKPHCQAAKGLLMQPLFPGECTGTATPRAARNTRKNYWSRVCLQIMAEIPLLSKQTGDLIQWKEFLLEIPDRPIRSAWLFFETLVPPNKTENWISWEGDSPGQSLREAEGQLIDFHVSEKLNDIPFCYLKCCLSNLVMWCWRLSSRLWISWRRGRNFPWQES